MRVFWSAKKSPNGRFEIRSRRIAKSLHVNVEEFRSLEAETKEASSAWWVRHSSKVRSRVRSPRLRFRGYRVESLTRSETPKSIWCCSDDTLSRQGSSHVSTFPSAKGRVEGEWPAQPLKPP